MVADIVRVANQQIDLRMVEPEMLKADVVLIGLSPKLEITKIRGLHSNFVILCNLSITVHSNGEKTYPVAIHTT